MARHAHRLGGIGAVSALRWHVISTQDERPISEASDATTAQVATPPAKVSARSVPHSGSLIVSSTGRVLSLTPGVPALLAHHGLGRIDTGILHFFDARHFQIIDDAAHRDTGHGDMPERSESFELSSGETLRMTASRLDLVDPDPNAAPYPMLLVALAIAPPRVIFPPEFAACGLTSAEQEIALAYASGGSVRSISADRNRGIETIRTHLKTAMSKLGVHRQVELALIVSRARDPR